MLRVSWLNINPTRLIRVKVRALTSMPSPTRPAHRRSLQSTPRWPQPPRARPQLPQGEAQPPGSSPCWRSLTMVRSPWMTLFTSSTMWCRSRTSGLSSRPAPMSALLRRNRRWKLMTLHSSYSMPIRKQQMPRKKRRRRRATKRVSRAIQWLLGLAGPKREGKRRRLKKRLRNRMRSRLRTLKPPLKKSTTLYWIMGLWKKC